MVAVSRALAGHAGWQVTARGAQEMHEHNGFEFPDEEMAAVFGEMSYVWAVLDSPLEPSLGLLCLPMPRTHDDEWDLASSVGATATMVAAGRAMATKDPRGLINDPFAEPLVRAVGHRFVHQDDGRRVRHLGGRRSSPDAVQAMIDGMAVRTKFFDEYFIEAADAGVRQAVILASGLDSRAYRLPWPAGTVVYELDQPQVIEFKTTHAGRPRRPADRDPAHRRHRPARRTGRRRCRRPGSTPTAPTAWLAEGLLIYLPPEAQDRLFDNITALSAPGSTIATEFVPGIMDFDADRDPGDVRFLPGARPRHRHGVAGVRRRAQPRDGLPARQGLGRAGRDADGVVPAQRDRRRPPRRTTTRSARSSSSAAGSTG